MKHWLSRKGQLAARESVAMSVQYIQRLSWTRKLFFHHEQVLGFSCAQDYTVEAEKFCWEFQEFWFTKNNLDLPNIILNP